MTNEIRPYISVVKPGPFDGALDKRLSVKVGVVYIPATIPCSNCDGSGIGNDDKDCEVCESEFGQVPNATREIVENTVDVFIDADDVPPGVPEAVLAALKCAAENNRITERLQTQVDELANECAGLKKDLETIGKNLGYVPRLHHGESIVDFSTRFKSLAHELGNITSLLWGIKTWKTSWQRGRITLEEFHEKCLDIAQSRIDSLRAIYSRITEKRE